MNKKNKLSDRAWFWPVVAIASLVLLSRGAALPAFASVFKFLLPFLGIYAGYRFVKWRIKKSILKSFQNATGEFQQFRYNPNMTGHRPEHRSSARNWQASPPSPDVIEICPKCGKEKSASCPTSCS